MTSDETPSADDLRYEEWLIHARSLHRDKRRWGMIGCLIGVVVMVWGRFGGGPFLAVWGGIGIVLACWILFAWVAWDRFQWVKNNPFVPTSSELGEDPKSEA